jgi:hypothetical protein
MCRTELELDSDHESQELECGNCLQLFVAKRPKPNADPPPEKPSYSRRQGIDEDDDPKRARRRRRYEYDDDDDYTPPPPPRGSPGAGDALAIVGFILGILALPVVCCWPLSLGLALGATVTGSLGLKSVNNKALAVAGLVLGILALSIALVMATIGFGPALFGR